MDRLALGEPHCGSHCHDRTAAPPLSIALPLRHCLFNTPPYAQAGAGFTGLLNYGFGDQVPQTMHPAPVMNWSRVTAYLDGLHAAGLRSVYMLNLFATHDGKDIRLPWWNTSTSKEVMTEFVSHIKDHPATLGCE